MVANFTAEYQEHRCEEVHVARVMAGNLMTLAGSDRNACPKDRGTLRLLFP